MNSYPPLCKQHWPRIFFLITKEIINMGIAAKTIPIRERRKSSNLFITFLYTSDHLTAYSEITRDLSFSYVRFDFLNV